VYEKVTGDTWMAVGDVRMQLGQCYRLMKKYDSALEHLEKALNMRRIKGEVSDISVAETLLQLALCRMEMGLKEEANVHVAEGLQICDKHSSATASLKAEFNKLQQKLQSALESGKSQAVVPPTQ
jgi:tetratricopeptide (TPR) repeat protein